MTTQLTRRILPRLWASFNRLWPVGVSVVVHYSCTAQAGVHIVP